MNYEFDPTERFIKIDVELTGQSGTSNVVAALDTGATVSVMPRSLLALIGQERILQSEEQIITAGGPISAMKAILPVIRALGCERKDLEILVADLPKELGVNALLGLDFFKGTELEIDFVNGYIEVMTGPSTK